MQRRHPVLLLELLISFVIIAIVLDLLFTGYRQATIGRKQLQLEKKIIFERQRVLLRLGSIFRSVKKFEQEDENFYLFSYEGGVDPEFDFRGPLEACLYLDKNRVVLVSWSKNGKVRTEVLDDDIEKIAFSFFNEKTGKFEPFFPTAKPWMMQVILTFKDNSKKVILPIFL